jgi:hypothetical protein
MKLTARKTNADQHVVALLDASDILHTKADAAPVREAAALRAGAYALAAMAQRISYGDANGVLAQWTRDAIDQSFRSSDSFDHDNA